jgi:subtilisin family serine protease
VTQRPAWSSAFEADALSTVQRIRPPEQISREWAWGGSTGAGVRVAVIDSGVEADHPAVGGRVSYAAMVDEGGEIGVDTSPHADDFGHGTACAGIIRSFAPECELTSVKVLGSGLRGTGAVFAAGLRWAIDNGMHVCNLSLGSTKRDFFALLHELTDEAYFRNVVLVAAANNMPLASYPSTYASVVSVASHDVHDPGVFYVNPEPPVEFGALGIDVRVAWKDGEWITATGNSFATPHIAGLVARLLGKHPGLGVVEVKSILAALADNVSPPRVDRSIVP